MNPSEPIGDEILARLAREPRFAQSYRLDAPIGRGGMALVARATALATQRPVAVKVLDGTWTPRLAERFVREGRLMAQVRHPNVLQVYDLGLIGGIPYLITEYAPGGTLREEILENGPADLARIAEVMVPVLHALAALHERSMVHRDLKPDNILFGADGQPRVADFGLALIAGEQRITTSGAFVGSVAYAAPEMLLGDPPSASFDVYAIGCILYEMIAGSPPFTARTTGALIAMIVQSPPPPLEGVPPEVSRAVASCLAKRPEDRPPNPAALAEEVARWPALPATPRGTRRTKPIPVPPPPSTGLRRRRAGYAGTLTAAMVAALALSLASRPPPAPLPSIASHAPLAAALARHVERGYEYLRRFNELVAKNAMLSSDSLGAGFPGIGKDAHVAREELRASIAPLRRSGARTREEHVLLARADAGEIAYWWVEEHVRGSLLPWNEPHEDDASRRSDREGLALHLSFQEHALAALAGRPEPAELHGDLIATLLDDIRSVSRGSAMHTWGMDALPRRKAATASFTRQLKDLGTLGEAALACWTWGAHGTFKKADRAHAAAIAASLRRLATEVTGGGDSVSRLADRLEKDSR